MFNIRATYLRHDGGTKFYETVLIHHKDGPAMLIKRWGSMDKRDGGGQTQVSRGTIASQKAEEQKILTEKRRARAGKGRYMDQTFNYGFHMLSTNVGPDQVRKALSHYDNAEVRNAIDTHFDLGEMNDVDDIVMATGEDFEIEEPQTERGSNWGSW